ncbi:MAG TPA: hypothetical protein VK970_10980 [Candidatus Methylacidiphilales bacterium]|nr:hypothetical protein [Candidatus Methylacidiphilales bacterium]
MEYRTCTVKKTAKRWRSMQCTACTADFAYLQNLIATGMAGTHGFTSSQALNEEADKLADMEMRKLLKCEDHIATSCPSCGSYNQNVCREALLALANQKSTRVGVPMLWVWLGLLVIAFALVFGDRSASTYTLSIGFFLFRFLFFCYLPVIVLTAFIIYYYVKWQDINAPAYKLERSQKRENNALLRSEFDELTAKMSPEDQEYALKHIHWSSRPVSSGPPKFTGFKRAYSNE